MIVPLHCGRLHQFLKVVLGNLIIIVRIEDEEREVLDGLVITKHLLQLLEELFRIQRVLKAKRNAFGGNS